jgi:hypothetical protein
LVSFKLSKTKDFFWPSRIAAQKNGHGAQYGWDEVESKSSCIDDGHVHAWDPADTFEVEISSLDVSMDAPSTDCRIPSLGR